MKRLSLKTPWTASVLTLCALTFFVGSAAAQSINTIRGANDVTGQPAPGADLIRHWIVAPDALCNDGTQPAAYVRRAQTMADRDNWIVFLEAGGSCESGVDCVDRWQSYQNNYGLQKMSTSIPVATWNTWYPAAAAGPSGWTLQGADYAVPTGITGNGIFSTAAINPFRNWNKVYLHYCSSDQWTGQQDNLLSAGIDHLGTPPATPPGTTQNYEINFHGARIFDQMITDLRTGTSYCQGEICEQMRSLDGANRILLAGSSAGANGVKHNLDLLRAKQNAINPNSEVRGVIDATGTPSTSSLPWPVAPAPVTSYQQRIDQQWNDVYLALWNARVDASCLLLNTAATASASTVSRCADPTHVLRHHITTPFFHRMDLQDENTMDIYTDVFFPAPPYAASVAPMNLANGAALQLREIGDYGTWLAPRYPAELATIAADPFWISPGVFGPRCTDHVGLTVNQTFFFQELPTPAGGVINYANTLFGWVNTAPPGLGGGLGPVLIQTVGVGSVGGAPCN
ncbi:MAG: pectin acetylesterase-family hydrolase [Pseudomonadota bacterium]|nr:pectin acetylesterase-family hydrolase [Pseudomonadota bacterium]